MMNLFREVHFRAFQVTRYTWAILSQSAAASTLMIFFFDDDDDEDNDEREWRLSFIDGSVLHIFPPNACCKSLLICQIVIVIHDFFLFFFRMEPILVNSCKILFIPNLYAWVNCSEFEQAVSSQSGKSRPYPNVTPTERNLDSYREMKKK